MWSKILLCLFVGLAAASNNGWKADTEYVYRIRGRTVTGLHDVDDQYSGIILRADLHIQPHSDGYLYAKIKNAEYSQIHAQLPGGWKSEIPESQLKYQQMALTPQPFKIQMQDGVVKDLVVSKEVPNWEANIIKSIVSQLQLDTQAQNSVRSSINQLPEEQSNDAVFKTMEETVTGKYQTLYDINVLPEFILQSKPYLAPFPHMKADGDLIEIVKTKNFSDAHELASYHYGFGKIGHIEPSSAHMGDFFLRSSVSRAVVAGTLKRYTIQSTYTTNKIVISPTLNSKQKGMVVSHLNLTLAHVGASQENLRGIQSPVSLKSLVYRFDKPFSSSNEPRPSEFAANHQKGESAYSSESSSSSSSSSSEENQSQQNQHRSNEQQLKHRQLRDLRDRLNDHQQQGQSSSSSSSSSSSQSFSSVSSEEYWQQDEPQLNQAPDTPLLPFYVGYKGKSIKAAQNIDIVQAVQKIAQQIGQDMQRPQQIPKEQTLAKYTILSALTRIMNEQEMKQVASQLYNKEQSGPKAATWKAYRDAIAECGTGPALLTVQEWIQSKKIRHEEAAEVIASVASSARQPTDQYVRTFYQLVTKDDVKQMALLNDTAILSFCNLVRRVYVNKYDSHNEYPVHTFGSFRSKEGYKFVVGELIPYLEKQLEKHVQQADSHKIAVDIRALGNIGHQKILHVFEQYLEGEKHVSQFQRLHMVLALDKLVQVQPKAARSVLYKIYQNPGEAQEVRVAAVYQLMRTAPSSSMLQRMAEYTQVDTADQVNAAVKSSIHSAAQLEGAEFHKLRTNARAARPLLTPKVFGAQYSKNYLRSYVAEQANLYYKHTFQTLGSDDSWLPAGIKASLRANLGGLKQRVYNAQWMVSSVEELTNVLEQQTEQHHKEHQQQEQQKNEALKHPWSAERIARLLNIKTEEREQLESNLLIHLGQTQRLFTINNRTIELLPEALREIESELLAGKNFEYTKFINAEEYAISFPTEMALPFIYTFDVPTVFQISGHVKAAAEPKISNGKRLQSPKNVKIQSEIKAVVSRKVESELGFITPFDHQKYSSGYDKNMHAYIPVKAAIEIEVENQEVHMEIQPAEPQQNTRVLHYSTIPYTARSDILSLVPNLNRPNTHVIDTKEKAGYESVIGKQNGLAFRVNYEGQKYFMDSHWLFQQLRRHDFISALMSAKYPSTVQYTKMSLEYLANESQSPKVQIDMGYDYQQDQSGKGDNEFDANKLQQLPSDPQQYLPRRKQMIQMVNDAIKGTHSVGIAEVSVQFQGQQKPLYYAVSAFARSNAHPQSIFVAYAKKLNVPQEKPFHLALIAKSQMPNTNGLDFNYALKFDPTSTTKARIFFGESLSASQVKINAEFTQSDERKLYLQNLPHAHQCKKEMEQGNQQLPACANLTVSANLMDQVSVNVEYQNIGPKVRNCTNKMYNALRYLGYDYVDENRVDVQGKPNQINIEAEFSPDFRAVNVSLEAENLHTIFKNVRVNEWAQRVVAVHPVFPVSSRVGGKLFGYKAFRPYCIVDHTACNTFDNKTYPIELGQDWTVMMQYVPRYGRYQQQHHQQRQQDEPNNLQTPEDRERLQNEQYVVLVRDSKVAQQQKDVRMTIRTPASDGKLVEIELYPAKQSSAAPKVVVNKQEKSVNEKEAITENGDIEIYALPNGEVKIEVLDRFYIIYDGQRVKLTTTNGQFRDAVRGLCGTFTGHEATDFRTPRDCIVRNPFEFAASYQVSEDGSQKQMPAASAKHSPCYYDEIEYSNVISDRDAGLEQEQQGKQRQVGSSKCTIHQTRYEQKNGKAICFSTRPLPACKSPCQPKGQITKSVSMHCLEKSSVTDHWQKRIDEGANVDFSHKEATDRIEIEVPLGCAM